MTLANTSAGLGRRRSGVVHSAFLVDLVLLSVIVWFAAAFMWQGGLEALCGGLLGAAAAAQQTPRPRASVSGAFAGLFIGALFAGFFHAALADAFRLIL